MQVGQCLGHLLRQSWQRRWPCGHWKTSQRGWDRQMVQRTSSRSDEDKEESSWTIKMIKQLLGWGR